MEWFNLHIVLYISNIPTGRALSNISVTSFINNDMITLKILHHQSMTSDQTTSQAGYTSFYPENVSETVFMIL